jgi:hypothetical protein
MRKKNEQSYIKLCIYLEEKMPNFIPENFLLDFKLAARQVFKNFYQKTVFSGCLFHFSQIMWRRIQKIGLAEKFRTIETVNLNIKLLLSLEFVPETQIADYYEELVEQIFKRDQKTDYSELLSFFEKNYLYKQDDIDFLSLECGV